MKKYALYVTFLFAITGVVSAATYQSDGSVNNTPPNPVTACSDAPSGAGVQWLHDNCLLSSASGADIITVPAGTFNWASTINVSKAVHIKGAGIGSTIVNVTGQAFKVTLVGNNPGTGKPTRISHFEFRKGGGTAVGFMQISGTNTDSGYSMRIDHNKFEKVQGHLVGIGVRGVADHNTINFDGGALGFFAFDDKTYKGDTAGYGDKSVASPVIWGSADFFFVEDNVITNQTTQPSIHCTDFDAGARAVVRHNILNDCIVLTHGTDSGGRRRTICAMEVYENDYVSTHPTQGNWGSMRGGTWLVYNNRLTGYNATPSNYLTNLRSVSSSAPFGPADGFDTTWDMADKSNGTGIFYTKVGGLTQTDIRTITISPDPGWATNQWVGYSLRRLTNNGSKTGPALTMIIGSTSNSIVYNGGTVEYLKIDPTDTIEFRRVLKVFDATTMLQGGLVTGGNTNPVAPWAPNSNAQVINPIYFNNNRNLSHGNTECRATNGTALSYVPFLVEGTNYFNGQMPPGYTAYQYPHPLNVPEGPTPTPGSPTPTPTPATPTPTPTPCQTPSPPSGLSCTTISSSQINLGWTDTSNNETGFRIERSPDGVTFTEVATLGANATTYSSQGLTPGTQYYYRVRSYITCTGPGSGCNPNQPNTYCSGPSNVVNCTTSAATPTPTPTVTPTPTPTPATPSPTPTPIPTPIAPSGLTATLISCVSNPGGPVTGEVDLAWIDNSSNETNFTVERSNNGVTYTPQTTTLPANTTTYASMQNQPGLRWWRVRATNAAGPSAYSNVASLDQPLCATPTPTGTPTPTPTPTPVPTPAAVVATAATVITTGSFQANWNAISGVTGYRIDVSLDAGFTFDIGYTNIDVGNVLLLNVIGLNSSTPYFYRVRAYNAGGTGANSNTITLTTNAGPTPTPTPTSTPSSPTPTPTPTPIGTPAPPTNLRVSSSPPP